MYSEALLTGQNLSLSEALAMGGETTVIGLAIVFAVLIILMIVLSLFRVIFYKKPKTQAAPAAAPKAASAGAGSIKVEAGAAGKVFKIEASVGQAVKKGDPVVVVEAMKMEIPVVAPEDGTVASIDVAVGDAVEAGATLATLN